MENASGLMSKRGAGGPEVENRGSTLRASWWAKGARESERERERLLRPKPGWTSRVRKWRREKPVQTEEFEFRQRRENGLGRRRIEDET